MPCARLAREAAKQDWAGLEFLAGIPGTLGGALRMNAGALGGEIWRFVESVETIADDGTIRRREAAEFKAGYRLVEGPCLNFIAATLRLNESANGTGAEQIRQVLAARTATQPTGQASCGSVFTNPPGDYAGRLIESCGLKQMSRGGAKVSEIHANFIVNDGSATACDVESLIEEVRRIVRVETGIELAPEVRIIGQASKDNRSPEALS